LRRFDGLRVEAALEATTGWRFATEERRAIGAVVDLAEPAETSARRGTKKRAKTDRADARHRRELLMVGRLPESWIAPDHLLDLRARVRLRHALVNRRGVWQRRLHSVLSHHGHPRWRDLLTRANRAWVERAALPATAREQIAVAVALIDALDVRLAPIDRRLRAHARRRAGRRALMAHCGIGALVSVVIPAEPGDRRRCSSSREAVRSAGPDITVHRSDQRRAPGHLSRRGPPALRWALVEAAQPARRTPSRDRASHARVAAERLGGNRACLAVARRPRKRGYHTPRELGEHALTPA
jgi:transposase